MTPDTIAQSPDAQRATLVCLHWLGGSRRSWDHLAAAFGTDVKVLAIDLPGFGDAAAAGGTSVAGMVAHVLATLRGEDLGRWAIAGHSMGAKVALGVVREAENGAAGLAGLERVVLLAGSPPAPEPMDEGRRSTMLGWFAGGPEQSRTEAQTFIDGNVGAPLDQERNALLLEDILRLSRQAWTLWLESGSREDWSDRIGRLATPALVVAGEKDADLGPDGQKALMTRHFDKVDLIVVDGAGHLLPVERPEEVARLIKAHLAEGASTVPPSYQRFIDSDRVSARVQGLMRERGAPDDPARDPKVMSRAQMTVLRAVVDRVLPQPEPRIDIAARMDEGLGTEAGDGWRFADLPSDQDSYRQGLDTLDDLARAQGRHGFADLDAAEQDRLLAGLPKGQGSSDPAPAAGRFSPHQMALWFEDLRANVVRVYMSHPLAMARYGFSGIGYGGDGPRLQGFSELGLGAVEPWEPEPVESAR